MKTDIRNAGVMTKLKKTLTLSTIAIAVYYGFEVYMGAMTKFFGQLGVFFIYVGMVMVNFAGVRLYDLLKTNMFFLDLGKNWIREGKGGQTWIKRFLLNGKWPNTKKALTFILLSILPCPMAGYLFIRKKENEQTFKVIYLLSLGSIPCTLVWGEGFVFFWKVLGFVWKIVVQQLV